MPLPPNAKREDGSISMKRQQEDPILGQIYEINSRGDILDYEGNVLGQNFGPDERLLPGKVLTVKGRVLDEYGHCVGYADSVRQPGTKTPVKATKKRSTVAAETPPNPTRSQPLEVLFGTDSSSSRVKADDRALPIKDPRPSEDITFLHDKSKVVQRPPSVEESPYLDNIAHAAALEDESQIKEKAPLAKESKLLDILGPAGIPQDGSRAALCFNDSQPVENSAHSDLSRDGSEVAGRPPQDRRSQLRKGLTHAGISSTEADEIIAIYMQQLSLTSPPPLPPRPQLRATSSSTPSSSFNAASDRRIMIFDQFNDPSSVIAQCLLESLRAWTANHRGPWLFHRVSCMSLDVEPPSQTGSAGAVANNPEAFFMAPGETPLDPTFLDDALSFMVNSTPILRAEDRPFEMNQIIERVRIGGYRKPLLTEFIDPLNEFAEYDHFFTFHTESFDRLSRAFQHVQTDDPSKPLYRPKEKGQQRAFVLPAVTMQRGETSTYFMNALYVAIREILHKEFGWEPPKKDMMNGELRTSFIQMKHVREKDGVVGDGGENIARIEKRCDCRLHVANQSDTYGWVAAIVGPKRRLWEAEALVRALMSGDDIEW